MSQPWELPASAWLDPRWNEALDLAAELPVSPAKAAAAWGENGPEQVLAKLRALAVGSGTKEAA